MVCVYMGGHMRVPLTPFPTLSPLSLTHINLPTHTNTHTKMPQECSYASFATGGYVLFTILGPSVHRIIYLLVFLPAFALAWGNPSMTCHRPSPPPSHHHHHTHTHSDVRRQRPPRAARRLPRPAVPHAQRRRRPGLRRAGRLLLRQGTKQSRGCGGACSLSLFLSTNPHHTSTQLNPINNNHHYKTTKNSSASSPTPSTPSTFWASSSCLAASSSTTGSRSQVGPIFFGVGF